MKKYRTVIAYKNYFEDLLDAQNPKVQSKILQIMRIIRVFCFFDDGKLVVLLSGFQKKSQKTPKNEIDKAVRLMNEYYKEKKESNS